MRSHVRVHRRERRRRRQRRQQIDGLAGDDQSDRRGALGEGDHLDEPPRSQRSQCYAVLDPLGVRRRHDLERDRLSEEPCLAHKSLQRDTELAERVLGEALARATGKALLGDFGRRIA